MSNSTKGRMEVSPLPLLDVAAGFMASKYLFVASELRIFEALAGGPMQLPELETTVQVAQSRLRLMLDGLVALGFVERHGERFQNSALASEYIAGAGGLDLRPLLRFWNELNYPLWTRLNSTVRTGKGVGSFRLNGEQQRVYSDGVAACGAVEAAALPDACNLQQYHAVLDLGGGNGTWLTPLLDRWPHLRGTVFELPGAAAIARERLGDRISEARVSVFEGDFLEDHLPPGHDVVPLANVIHGLSVEESRRLLHRVRVQAMETTRLLLVDLWTGVPQPGSRLAALMAGSFLVTTGKGMTYDISELIDWLRDTGWSFVGCEPLPIIASVIVADASW